MRVYTENDSYEFYRDEVRGWQVDENGHGWRTLVEFPTVNIGEPMRFRFVNGFTQMTEEVVDVEHADD